MALNDLPLHFGVFWIWMLGFGAEAQYLLRESVLRMVCNHYFNLYPNFLIMGCKTIPTKQKVTFTSDCFGCVYENCSQAFKFRLK